MILAPSPSLSPLRLTLAVVPLVLAACAPAAPEATLFPSTWEFAQVEPSVTGSHGAVSSSDAYATEVGLNILKAGGNAVDAAVATGFALAVVNPAAGNIGGGGFLVIRTAEGVSAALDYRERAPLRATHDMYLDEEGNVTDQSLIGHLAVGVPGTVMGLWEAHQRFGTLPWESLVNPAIELAQGLLARERLVRSLESSVERLSLFEATRTIFLPGGVAPAVGDTFRQPDLASTLTRIRDHGPDGFYTGETADLIVAEMERGGGLISHRDLATYEATWREPIRFTYRGHQVISMPPSSSGGMTLAEMANILEERDLGGLGFHSAAGIHVMVEAWRRSFSDRNEYLADPDFVEIPTERMTSKTYAAERAADISMDRATPSSEVGPGMEAPREGDHTTHFSVVDGMGTAVAVTTTINSGYGSRVTVAGAGFLLNNEMDDFTAKPGTANLYGLVQGERNAIEPGKRMLSAMTPTIVLNPAGELLLVLGSPGGPTIITSVFQTISGIVDHGLSLGEAIAAPRLHHQHLPDQIFYEKGGLAAEVVAALRALGHTMVERGAEGGSGLSGDVQAILVGPDGVLQAHSDPRRGGTAMAY